MRKKLNIFIIVIVLFCLTVSEISAQPAIQGNAESQNDDWDEMDCTRKIKLSPSTKKRLDANYHRIYMAYYDLIETYAWAGALTREQRNLRLRMLRNYILTFQRRNYQWCSEHEPDEWEEEWFNSD